MRPTVTVVRESKTTALLDSVGGLGHVPADQAMRLAIAKCRSAGVGVVTVRGSGHFGAAGSSAAMAVHEGMIGLALTSVRGPAMVPTFGNRALFGTSPIAFAAPAGLEPPFLLDLATSAAAIGKLATARRSAAPGKGDAGALTLLRGGAFGIARDQHGPLAIERWRVVQRADHRVEIGRELGAATRSVLAASARRSAARSATPQHRHLRRRDGALLSRPLPARRATRDRPRRLRSGRLPLLDRERAWPIAATPGFLARNASVFTPLLRRRARILTQRQPRPEGPPTMSSQVPST